MPNARTQKRMKELGAPRSAPSSLGELCQEPGQTGRTDAEAEAPVLWPPDAKSLFTGKDPDAGKE